MIRVERENAIKNGKSHWRCAGWGIEGYSREPLLDACRVLKRMGAETWREVGLFRPGWGEWDLKTTVGYGASWTVREDDKGIRLVKYQAFDRVKAKNFA